MKLRSIFMAVLLLAIGVSLSSAQPRITLLKLSFSNPGFAVIDDTLGSGVGYTACIDKFAAGDPDHLFSETEQPPVGPPGNPDARFYDDVNAPECLGAGLKLDIHAGSTSVSVVDTFEFSIQVGDRNVPWYLIWDTTNINKKLSSLVIHDGATDGAVMNIDMMTRDSITFTKTNAFKNVTTFLIYVTWNRITTGVVERLNAPIPTQFVLNQNYPNPFNPSTNLQFSILRTAFTEVAVYNILGQKVATLVAEQLTPGSYTTKWNGTDDRGLTASSGVYFIRMRSNYDNGGQFSAMRKIVLMK